MDQRALELGDAGEHGQHHPARRAGRIGPGLGQTAQPGIRLPEPLGNVEQVARRAREPVEAGHHDHVLLAQVAEQTGQFGPVATCSGALLRVDPPAASVAQRRTLECEVLVVGADASIAEEHGAVRAGSVVQNCIGTPSFCNGLPRQAKCPSCLARSAWRETAEFRDRAGG